ncbi:unnamed protein product [Mytilus edulis]|uniref:PKD/REJ-like domain-containing protein n=1 Tax=Mytilus edulis TaxID=6550 RepID=A0A8S3SDJ8_MYTED|nr:unnamed protein product [Mytilus edulis]
MVNIGVWLSKLAITSQGVVALICRNSHRDYNWHLWRKLQNGTYVKDKYLVNPANQPKSAAIIFAKESIPEGNYLLRMSVYLIDYGQFLEDEIYVEYRLPPIITSIQGGSVRYISKDNDVVIDAGSVTYDKVQKYKIVPFNYEWLCRKGLNQSQVDAVLGKFGLPGAPDIITLGTSCNESSWGAKWTIPSENLSIDTWYLLHVKTQKVTNIMDEELLGSADTIRSATALQALKVRTGDAPMINILKNCLPKLSLNSLLILNADCPECSLSDTIYEWSILVYNHTTEVFDSLNSVPSINQSRLVVTKESSIVTTLAVGDPKNNFYSIIRVNIIDFYNGYTTVDLQVTAVENLTKEMEIKLMSGDTTFYMTEMATSAFATALSDNKLVNNFAGASLTDSSIETALQVMNDQGLNMTCKGCKKTFKTKHVNLYIFKASLHERGKRYKRDIQALNDVPNAILQAVPMTQCDWTEINSLGIAEFPQNVYIAGSTDTALITSDVHKLFLKNRNNKNFIPTNCNIIKNQTTRALQFSQNLPVFTEGDASNFFYHSFFYRDNGDYVCVSVLPVQGVPDYVTSYDVYVKFDSQPTHLNYDAKGRTSPDNDRMICLPPQLISSTGEMHVGLHANSKVVFGSLGYVWEPITGRYANGSYNISAPALMPYNLRIVTSNCKEWDPKRQSWDSINCENTSIIAKHTIVPVVLYANKRINNALDSFEAEIKHELTQNFDSEKNRLLVRRNDYLQKMDEIKKEKHIISNVANIEIKSNKHLFLLQGQMNDKLKLKESAVKDLITPLEDVSLECNVDLDIDMHSGCLMLTRTVAFHRSPSEIDLEVLHIESESETTEIMEDDEIQ